ncbi:MAG: hypothetical protein GF401_10135 [Chitinivibrionales bacterium]|nr:hypothetical protein [Chitinivibrionales bacterium]
MKKGLQLTIIMLMAGVLFGGASDVEAKKIVTRKQSAATKSESKDSGSISPQPVADDTPIQPRMLDSSRKPDSSESKVSPKKSKKKKK